MTLWTPGGEHPVDRDPSPAAPTPPLRQTEPTPGDDPLAGLSPEERARAEAMATEMAEVRRQLAETPAAVVVANHAMGLYELAAIHLSEQPPKLSEARLAIDAMGAVVEGLAGRLGENENTLREALNQLRMAFVQLRGAPTGGTEPAPGS